MATVKVIELSDGAKAVLETLKGSFPNGATLKEIKEVFPTANASHLTALKTRGLVTSEPVEIETVRVVKSTVQRYTISGE